MSVLISEKANAKLISAFDDVILVGCNSPVYEAVACHPDIYYCRLPNGNIFSSKAGEIGEKYPENIGFNAVCLDKYFIHNLKYTNPRLKAQVSELGLIAVNVKQGYTKCSCVVVNGNSIITADEGIYKVLSDYSDINVLKISAGYVSLYGCEYGFLGGASGKVGDTLFFNGDLSKHPDCEDIVAFSESFGVKVKWFDYPLEDIGSIISVDKSFI